MLRRAINAFQRVLMKEAAADTRLGTPSTDEGHAARRKNAMAAMTGGRGFREDRRGEPGWGIAALRDAIEQRQHLAGGAS